MVEHSHEVKKDLYDPHAVFSPERWVSQMKKLGENPDKLDMEVWIEMLYETTHLFKKMGSAMSQAFSGMHFSTSIIT